MKDGRQGHEVTLSQRASGVIRYPANVELSDYATGAKAL